MVRNNIIFKLYSFLLFYDSVLLSSVGFCVCSNCHPLFICLWCWWTIKKGEFPGFLEGAASLFPSPAGPGVSAASHLQPVPSLGRGRLHTSSLSHWALGRVSPPLASVLVRLAESPGSIVSACHRLSLPPLHAGTGCEKAFCPSFSADYFSSLLNCRPILGFIHIGWDPDIHLGPCRSL